MKSAEDIRKYFQKSKLSTNPDRHEAIFEKIQYAQNQSRTIAPASYRLNLKSNIMKNPIIKLAAAAVIVIAVLIGVSQLGGSGTSIVWAEVAQKVQASRGVIFRGKDSTMDSQNSESDYTMNYLSGTHSRLDYYKGDQIVKTIYSDFNTKTVILVDNGHKSYVKMTFEKMEQSSFMVDPKKMVQRFPACEHRELEPKTIEGVLCEGIETTDPAFDGSDYPTDSLIAQIWVSVDTGYPVQSEAEIIRNNGKIQIGGISDQFQWDVELDESMFEPNIPTDYIDISP
jgi:hypothetical protein